MADRSLRKPEDKHIANSRREVGSKKALKSCRNSNNEKAGCKNQVLPGTQSVKSNNPKKRNREVDNLKAAGVANSELLEQPVRVTRSQWRRSIAEGRDRSSSTDTDRLYLNSSNPTSRSTSRSSSRTASPVFRLRDTGRVEEPVANGGLSGLSICGSSGNRIADSKKINGASAVPVRPGADKNVKRRKSSHTGSRDASPEHSSERSNFERKNKRETASGSHINSKSRSHKKTVHNFATAEEPKLTKIPIVLSTVEGRGASLEPATGKERGTFPASANKFTSKGLWTSKIVENTAKVAGKKRVRSFSKTQASAFKREKREDPAVKREKRDEGSSVDRSELKANSSKTSKTGGRLSRARTSQAQTGERRSTTGSCASNRRSSRRSRAQQESSNMATDDARNNQQAEAMDNEPRVDEPIPGSSGSRDSATNQIEDSEISRLQALLEARGLPSHLFGNLGPRMHLLLQRTFSSSAGTKAQQLLTGMQSDDEGQQLTSVMEMCQLLVMGNEETLGGFPVKQAVPVLITLLQMEHNFDITNHACRALTYLMEALPRSSAVVVEAIPSFLEKLQVIQCMDVAEQSLTALEMLSRRHGKAILQAGGLNACLLYLDFFSIVAQRCALGIASNCCQSVTPEEFHHVKDAIPILSGRLSNQDKKSLENVCSAFARLVDNFQREKVLLQELCAHGILPNLQQLVMISPPIISTSTFVMVIRMLAVMCANCPTIAVQLLQQNISDTIRYLLIGNPTEEGDKVANNELLPRTPQELYEITSLISELFPRLPSSGVFCVDALLVKGSQQNNTNGCWQWRDDRGIWHNYMWVDNRILEAAHQSGEDEISLSTLGRNYIIDFTNMQQINEDTGTIRSIQRKSNTADSTSAVSPDKEIDSEDERKTAINDEPSLGEAFVKSLLSVMYDVYYSSVGPAVKHKCLNSALKMLYHSKAESLRAVLESIPISSYLAGMLTSNDPKVVCCALQKAEILMIKLPDIFHVSFRREGVMHRAKSLSVKGTQSSGPSPEKNKDASDVRGQGMATARDMGRSCDIVDGLLVDLQKSSTEGKAETSKRKKLTKRSSRQKQNQATVADDLPSASSKKSSSSTTSKTRAATFSATTTNPSTGSSKTSFFSSFAPRWGRSQSYSNAAATAGSKERLAKEADENKDKIKNWIKDQASRFYEAHFVEQFTGDSHPALNILHRLTKASEDLSLDKDTGIIALKEISDVLKEKNDHGASAFEILHSGLIKSLLKYLTVDSIVDSVPRNIRLKRFLHVFLGCPDPDLLSTRSLEPSAKPSLPALVQKLNLCINQLEQFAVKCHDLPGAVNGSRGTSALRFFNTHQIKCNLQRNQDCHTLRQWKGGTVKIDPLALVQAVERYLVIRGFGKLRDHGDDDDSDDEDGTDGEIDEAWGSAIGAGKPKHYLELVLNGRVLPYDMTIYQAVRQYGDNGLGDESNVDDDQGPLGRASIWSETHTIYYRPINQTSVVTQPATKKRSEASASSSTSSSKSSLKSLSRGLDKEKNGDLSFYLTDSLPSSVQVSDPSLEAVCLMRVLYYLNINWGNLYEIHQPQATVSITEFINAKLTAKVSRQLQDPLAIMTGNLPAWLTELSTACPFLFPFECRQQLFYATTFDRDRALMKLQETVPELANADTAERVTPRLEKKKRTVPRTDLLKQAENVMNDVAGGRAMLEIQYEGEVGSGLGPTLEFYTLVSKELQKAELQVWRGDVVEVAEASGESKESTSFVHSPCGLFPAPLPKNSKVAQLSKVKSRFRFLGKFVAKAIMDSRMIDIPFSQPFCKWMVGLESTFQLSDIQNIDGTLFKSLSQLNDVVKKKKAIEKDHSHTIETLQLEINNLTLDGVSIDDLGLDFILPGYPNIELKKNGKDIPVTIQNLEEYIKLVIHWTLIEGVSKQFQAFREGFESVFTASSVQMFYPAEIDLLLCGSRSEKWDVKELIECCRPDHGYSHDSRAVRFLFDILSKYDSEDQRKFLQFITGSPRLPVGGFRSLNPQLTIVRKTVDGASSPDNYLPSVMTCVNYLKLPDYSSVEVMDEKLRTAYTEGKNAFHLS